MTNYKAVGLPIFILSQEILTNEMKEADVLRSKAGISIGEIISQLALDQKKSQAISLL